MENITDKLLAEGIITSDLANEIRESFEMKVQAELQDRLAEELEVLKQDFESQKEFIIEKAEEYTKLFSEEMKDKIDSYLDLIVTSWVDENSKKIDSLVDQKRNDALTEGLRSLLITAGISMDSILESKDEVSEIEDLKNLVDSYANKVIDLKKENENLLKESLFKDLTGGLTHLQAEKVRAISESIDLDINNKEEYISKINLIKENLLNESKPSKITEFNKEVEFGFTAKSKIKNDKSLIGSASHLF